MLRLRSSVEAERAGHFGALLRDIEGVRRVVQQPDEAAATESVVFVADVEPAAADRLVEAIGELLEGEEDVLTGQVVRSGAASFLYELFPSFGNAGVPDLATISSFFGAERDAATGTWHSNNKERIPENW